MGEAERRAAYRAAAAHLPTVDMSDWVWTEQEVEVLRRACGVRFDESLRTESLFTIAQAAMRIAQARARLGSQGGLAAGSLGTGLSTDPGGILND